MNHALFAILAAMGVVIVCLVLEVAAVEFRIRELERKTRSVGFHFGQGGPRP
jgi:hypothetical protein